MQRRSFIATTGAAGVLSLAGCMGQNGGTDTDSDVATLGAGIGLSGIFAAWGQAYELGFELAIEQANERDDIEIDFNYESIDTESNPAEAVTAKSRLIEQSGASMITGSLSSDVGIQSAQLAEDMQVPNLLLNSGTHAALDRDSRYTFRFGWFPAPTHVRADLAYIEDQGYDTVGAIVADYAWGHAVETSMEEFYPDEIEFHIERAPQGESDFTPYLRDMPDVDVMTHVGHPGGASNIVSQQAELGTDVPTLGVDGPQQMFVDALDDDTIENLITRHLVDMTNDRVQELGEEISEREGITMYAYEPTGYAAGQLFVDAVLEVGNNPEAIADYIRENDHDVMYGSPLQYTEWGEFDNMSMFFSEMTAEAPEYDPNGEYRMDQIYQTDELPAFDPGDLELD